MAVHLISSCLLYISFVLLSLAMPRHRRELNKAHPLSKSAERLFQCLGFAMLAASGALCIYVDGIGLGLVYWLALLTLAALLLALLFSYRPWWVINLTIFSGAVIATCIGFSTL